MNLGDRQAADLHFLQKIQTDFAIGPNHLFGTVDLLDIGSLDDDLIRRVDDVFIDRGVMAAGHLEKTLSTFGIGGAFQLVGAAG